MKLARTSVLAVLVFALTTTAYAGLVHVSGPLPGSSYENTYALDAAGPSDPPDPPGDDTPVGSFDLIAVEMLTAGYYFESLDTATPLLDPSLNEFTITSWGILFEDESPPPKADITLASASGPSVDPEDAQTTLTFHVRFEGDSYTNILQWGFVAYSGETITHVAIVDWNGPATTRVITNYPDGVGEGLNWTPPARSEVDPDPPPVSVIPAPGALLLGVIGVGLVAAARRRRR